MQNDKYIAKEQLASATAKLKEKGLRIVTLNGSFDLLHAGHLHILREAKLQGDVLIVALNSDESIRAYKSPDRPIIPLENRLEMMAAIMYVDYVTYFDELNPIAILEIIKPDVHCNGSEYGQECLEADVVKKHGGKIHVIELVPGLSTSNIIEKIKALCVT